jgi:hypothetical protein
MVGGAATSHPLWIDRMARAVAFAILCLPLSTYWLACYFLQGAAQDRREADDGTGDACRYESRLEVIGADHKRSCGTRRSLVGWGPSRWRCGERGFHHRPKHREWRLQFNRRCS